MNYETRLVKGESGFTEVVCKTCGAAALVGEKIPHASVCRFANDDRLVNRRIRSEIRTITTPGIVELIEE